MSKNIETKYLLFPTKSVKVELSALDKTCEKQAFLIWVFAGVGAPF